MAHTCQAIFLLLTSVFCAASCSFDKQKLDQVLGDDTRKLFDFEEPLSIEILVTGRVGVGKSTLVNALVGTDVAKTGTDVRGVTKNLERKVSAKNGIHMYITDTPGLGNLDTDDEDTLRIALEHSNSADTDLFFLFCMNMTHRFDHQYVEEMKAITNIFGKAVWKKGMILLTSANAWNEKEKFISKVHEWEDALRKITKQFIDPEVAKKIPIVPTGFKEPQLPDRPSWVTDVWIQGFRRMGFKAFKYLILLNETKLYNATGGVKPSQDIYENFEDRSLVKCYKNEGWIQWICKWIAFVYDCCMEEAEVHCYDEAILYSLLAAFLE